MGYRQVDTGSGGVPGGVWPAPPGAATFVQLFVGVADVEQSVTEAIELGAKVVVHPTSLPDGDDGSARRPFRLIVWSHAPDRVGCARCNPKATTPDGFAVRPTAHHLRGAGCV